ncbi:hypothetical protein JTE90_003304 [Oedothorax gibbosus]|uniref:Uncharacterized protein n=1 Tax=Oedothorax gibbosus TaxID=931172 RepID=A0AAV6TY02_9ARAC|nr:hypothetical protein JTE90_003304 [Oedothorax gibbosus]
MPNRLGSPAPKIFSEDKYARSCVDMTEMMIAPEQVQRSKYQVQQLYEEAYQKGDHDNMEKIIREFIKKSLKREVYNLQVQSSGLRKLIRHLVRGWSYPVTLRHSQQRILSS